MEHDPGEQNRLQAVLEQFGLAGEMETLPGGSQKTFRVGQAVLKHVGESSLENNHSPELAAWIAGFTASLRQEGFRLPRPLPARDGAWITPGGWTAWSLVAGRHARRSDIPACIPAIAALHRALQGIPAHPRMAENQTPWGKAHRWCWGEPPDHIHPRLKPWVEPLYALRRPIVTPPWQLIHGDLNPENILVEDGLPPAFLDFSPFWGPPDFALAIFANFIGPRRDDPEVLQYFAGIPNFDQLLVRAAIRMLLVMSEIDRLDDWETCSEKRAAELILARLSTR